MNKGRRLKRFGGGLVLILVVLVAGYLLIRPGLLRWGATDSEISAVMPGELNGMRWTRAISINATPAEIYPWLLQWGQGRGGWYSYDWVENLLGFDIHSANYLLPEFQNPVIGDPICMAKGSCTNQIFLLEQDQYFGWQAKAENGSSV